MKNQPTNTKQITQEHPQQKLATTHSAQRVCHQFIHEPNEFAPDIFSNRQHKGIIPTRICAIYNSKSEKRRNDDGHF